MSNTIIRVENLSKKYILSHQQEGQQYKALRDVIADGVMSISQRLIRSNKQRIIKPSSEEFWALNDISFNIRQGSKVGIIGRNGAGKSTLLKILSHITAPTTGKISIKGRVASLLEVGTGFHPELTGRENIYLNGAILGMGRTEIQRKFDEIVSFAEVERFLDTPVKRYSSGMYVRLAFAVAAHLEPEILIVDEVLAVGDAQFQKKCLGKMGEVSDKEGRTVLFVSHSMQAVAQLTNQCILLSKGNIQFIGNTEQAVLLYLSNQGTEFNQPGYYEASKNKKGNHIAWAKVHTSNDLAIHCWGEPIVFEFALNIIDPHQGIRFDFQIINSLNQIICTLWSFDPQALYCREDGTILLRCKIPKFRMYMGSYTLSAWLVDRRSNVPLDNLSNVCSFEITMHHVERGEYRWHPNECTYLEDFHWQISRNDSAKLSLISQ